MKLTVNESKTLDYLRRHPNRNRFRQGDNSHVGNMCWETFPALYESWFIHLRYYEYRFEEESVAFVSILI